MLRSSISYGMFPVFRKLSSATFLLFLHFGVQAADKPLTIAVFGDWPYNQLLLDKSDLLVNTINADPDVSLVIHLGDIHAGSEPCSGAGLLPPSPKANPAWNRKIYEVFQQFDDPLVYTPGDNEWSDCHRKYTGSSGDPLKELAALRSLFFAKPGFTMGKNARKMQSQAHQFDAAYPADAQYVENIMWQESGIVFFTVNMPGSNNDSLPWQGRFANPVLQEKEIAERTAANIRWMQRAFRDAEKSGSKAVVIAMQADMWERYAAAMGGDGLDGYVEFVKKLAELCAAFGKPVLLLNGDSHHYGWDKPLADPNNFSGKIHGARAAPNLTRVIVQGALHAPAEWLKLTIDTSKINPFSWVNVSFCKNPEKSCVE